MSQEDVVQRYVAAWNTHDAAALMALFAHEGAYSDPSTVQPLRGEAIAGYANSLWSAFPDLTFEQTNLVSACDGQMALQWLMRGTNQGPVLGLPPTGSTIALPGMDMITVEGEQIRSVQGYFDRQTFVEQLGLQAVVQPKQLGPFVFGTSVLVQSGKRTEPGAFSLTMIDVRSDEEADQVRTYSRRLVREMCDMDGFISWMGVSCANRLMTVTAWEDSDGPRQLMQNQTHRESVKLFFTPHFSNGAMTSVWLPDHIKLWMRCPSCGRMNLHDPTESKCSCGARLPESMTYW